MMVKKYMKISVVMSTYNGALFLKEQLMSIMNQTYPIDEVIIFDDASGDNTVDILNEFIFTNKLNKSWHVFSGHQNKGYILSFTEALKHATGDIIFLADQDDIWDINKIELMTKYMSENSHILTLNTSFDFIDECGNSKNSRNVPFSSNNGWMLFKIIKKGALKAISQRYILKQNITPGCAMAVRKELLTDFFALRDEGIIPHDWKLNYLATCKKGCYFLNKSLIQYRIHSNNTIGTELSQTLSSNHRIHTYRVRVNVYNALNKIWNNVSKRENAKNIRFCEKRISYYNRRIKNLENNNIPGVIFLSIYSIFWIGLEGLTTVMDLGTVLEDKKKM